MWNFNFPRQSIWAQPTAKVWTVLSHILNFKLGMENMHHHWPSDCTFNLNSSINKCCWQKTQPHYQKNYKGFTTMFVCTPFVWWTILCSVTQTAGWHQSAGNTVFLPFRLSLAGGLCFVVLYCMIISYSFQRLNINSTIRYDNNNSNISNTPFCNLFHFRAVAVYFGWWCVTLFSNATRDTISLYDWYLWPCSSRHSTEKMLNCRAQYC